MSDPVRITHFNDPDMPARIADAFGQPMGAIYATDLDDWAWLLEHLRRLAHQHAGPTPANDYRAFVADRYGPAGGPTLSDVCWMLAASRFGCGSWPARRTNDHTHTPAPAPRRRPRSSCCAACDCPTSAGPPPRC